jgi:hypothetical protein
LKGSNNAHKNSRVANFDVWAPYSSLMGIKGVSKCFKNIHSLSLLKMEWS